VGSARAYCRSAHPIAFRRKNSFEASEGSMHAKRSPGSVSPREPSWQRIAERRFQRSSLRAQASIARLVARGSFARSSPRRCAAIGSTTSHQAPVTTISSQTGRKSRPRNRAKPRHRASSTAAYLSSRNAAPRKRPRTSRRKASASGSTSREKSSRQAARSGTAPTPWNGIADFMYARAPRARSGSPSAESRARSARRRRVGRGTKGILPRSLASAPSRPSPAFPDARP